MEPKAKRSDPAYPPHRWELFRNPRPNYQRASWENEEQEQKNREGFVIATAPSIEALQTLAEVFEPHEVQIRPRPKKRRGRKPQHLSLAAE